jgi:hypothetical protein
MVSFGMALVEFAHSKKKGKKGKNPELFGLLFAEQFLRILLCSPDPPQNMHETLENNQILHLLPLFPVRHSLIAFLFLMVWVQRILGARKKGVLLLIHPYEFQSEPLERRCKIFPLVLAGHSETETVCQKDWWLWQET